MGIKDLLNVRRVRQDDCAEDARRAHDGNDKWLCHARLPRSLRPRKTLPIRQHTTILTH